MRTIPRSRRFVAVLCVAILVCAVLTPSAIHLTVDLSPGWIAAPFLLIVIWRRSMGVGHERSLSLLSLGDARAPPVLFT